MLAEATDSASVLDVMAQAASPTAVVDGVGGRSERARTPLDRRDRNARERGRRLLLLRGHGTDMAPIFMTALSQVSKGIKLIKMP